MIDPEVQPLRIKIELTYEATLYDGDPADAFEIASLEREAIEDVIRNYIESVVGPTKYFDLTVQPD